MKRCDTSDGLKACSRCRERKPPGAFYADRQTSTGLSSSCRECWSGYVKTRRIDQVERYRESARRSMQRQRARAREAVLRAYGGRCACCGEDEPAFLALDHVADDGSEHRRALATTTGRPATNHVIYRHVIARGFPPDFQLLCHNCNMGKAILGECPHARARREAA